MMAQRSSVDSSGMTILRLRMGHGMEKSKLDGIVRG